MLALNKSKGRERSTRDSLGWFKYTLFSILLLFIYEIVRVCVLRVLFAFARCLAHLARCLALRRERSARDWRFPCSLFNETLCFYFSFQLCRLYIYTKLCVCVCCVSCSRLLGVWRVLLDVWRGVCLGVWLGVWRGLFGHHLRCSRKGPVPSLQGVHTCMPHTRTRRPPHACHTPECAAHPNASSESNSRVVGSKQ